MENILSPLFSKILLSAISYLIFLPLVIHFYKKLSFQDFNYIRTSSFYLLKKYKWWLLIILTGYCTIAFLYPFDTDEVWLFSYFYKKPILSPFVFYDLPTNHIAYSNISVLFTYIWNSIYTWRLVSVFFLGLSVILYFHFLKKHKNCNAFAITLIFALLPMTINTGVHGKGYAMLYCIFLVQLLSAKYSSLFYWIGILVHPAFIIFGGLPIVFHFGKNSFNKTNALVCISGIAFYSLMYASNNIPHNPGLLSLSQLFYTNYIYDFLLNGLINKRISEKFTSLIFITIIGLALFKRNRLSSHLLIFSCIAVVGFYLFSQKIIHYRMLITLPFLISFVIGRLIVNKFLLIGTAIILTLNFFISERIFLRYKHHKFLEETAMYIISSPKLKNKRILTDLNRLSTYVEYYSVKNKIPYQWKISTELQQADTTFIFSNEIY